MNTLCNQCRKPISGRSDKEYCSEDCCSEDCRSEAHRLRSKSEMKVTIETNAMLLRNRQLLKALCKSGPIVVERKALIALGLNFSVFASLYVTASNRTNYLCYDYAFSPSIENNVMKAIIVAKLNYLPEFDPWSSFG
jgi:hypothetical protein